MANDATIHVAFCIDRTMVKPAAAAILSLVAAVRGALHIHACIGPDAEAAAALEGVLRTTGAAFDVNVLAPETAYALPFISPYGGKSTAAYRRVVLDALYPELDRILYLDADVMACRDPTPLWQTDLDGHAFGAVRDPWWVFKPEREALFPGGYFNSGVLLIDLAQWRRRQLAERVAHYVRAWKSGQRIGLAGDPDALTEIWGFQTEMNAALAGLWRPLSSAWNASTYHFNSRFAQSPEMAPARTAPGIVHFMGHEKPWDDTFARLTATHRDYQPWRAAADAALPDFAWPPAYAERPERRRLRATTALGLIAQARRAGVRRAVLVGGPREMAAALPVAAASQIEITALAMMDPGTLLGVAGRDILSLDQALAAGEHSFLLLGEDGAAEAADLIAARAAETGTLPTVVSPGGVLRAPPARLRIEATTQLRCPACPPPPQ